MGKGWKGADVLVLGAGVIGLTIAVRLIESGHGVLVLTDLDPGRTTLAAAGAMLGISGTSPDDPPTRWTQIATPIFEESADGPTSGVHRVHGQIVANFADEAPPRARVLPDFRALSAGEHPGFRSGLAVTLPFADMPTYLGYLHARLIARGGRLEMRHVNALVDVAGGPPLVNATGVGARELCGDASLTRTRGVQVVVDNIGIDEFRVEAVADPVWTNIFLYPSHIVLGGAALPEDGPSDDEAALAAWRSLTGDGFVRSDAVSSTSSCSVELSVQRLGRRHSVGVADTKFDSVPVD
ncbi:MAG: FAD-dependent oxidoreductase, partial [Ornithinimicrobium sp.]